MPDNLTGKTVFHKKFGTGIITAKKSNDIILVRFDDEEKKFVYPAVFQNQLLTTYDEELEAQIKQDIEVFRKSVSQKSISKFRYCPKRISESESSNIAFKYNYCDGGETSEWFGFSDVCTDEMIRYNIEVAKRSWCSDKGCPCRWYYDGKISLEELSAEMKGDNYVCQESGFFKFEYWCANAERDIRKDLPRKILNARANSLAVMTTRKPYDTEDKRFIFCVYLVDEYFEGNDNNAGYVSSNQNWKIELTKQEAYQMKFWNYHANDKNPSRAKWGSGIIRYISDNEAVQILRDIVTVIAPEDKDYAQKFLQYYCEINRINEADVPPPSGALRRKRE